MKTTMTWIALALAGTLAAQAQEAPPEGGQRERRPGNRQMPPEVLKEFDKDGDGKLNDEESKAAREAMQARREEARKKMLEKYDADKDGKLNEEETKKMREDQQAKHKALVEKYDADKDGKLSREEIKTARDAGEEIPMRPMGGQRGPRGEGGERPARGEGRPPRGQGGGERPAPPAGE